MSHLVIDSLVQNNQAYLLKKYNVSDLSQSSDFIGDFNGDGIDDFVLSAPFQYSRMPGSDSKGYVIYGNIENALDFDDFTPNDGLVLITPSYNYTYEDDSYPYSDIDGFASGHSISFAGDFNDDGYDDIIVSIFYYNNTQGIHYLVYGGVYSSSSLYLEDIDSSRGFAIYGSENLKYDASAHYIGDFNGDGIDDIAIHENIIDESSTPTISIIYGKSNAQDMHLNNFTPSNGFKIKAQPYFGYWRVLDTIGDVNNDGFSDIAIAASIVNDGDLSSVFVIFGSNQHRDINLNMFNSSIGYNITGLENESMVRGLGDFNGDGVPDFLIGSHNEGSDYQGKLYVIFGNRANFEGFDIKDINDRGFIVSGKGSFDQIGEVISNGLDVNNDGFNDILIGSSNDIDGAYVIFGGTNTSNIDLGISSDRFLSIGMVSGAEVRSVNSAGDFNNDGYDDFVISYLYENYNILIQEHYLVFDLYNTSRFITGTPSGVPISEPTANPSTEPSFIPTLISTASPTMVISEQPTNNPTVIQTIASTFSSDSALNINLGSLGSKGFEIRGVSDYGDVASGYSVSGAGDINGDGYKDIIVSSIYESNSAGITYVIFGKSSFSNINLDSFSSTQGFAITGKSNYGESGKSVKNAGDFNGDGYDDIIIGAPSVSSYSGEAYIMFGKSEGLVDINVRSLTNSNGLTIRGSTGSEFGYSVSGAGDINGDGYDDVIVSAPGYTTNYKLDIYYAYLIFGKNSGFTTIDIDSLTSSQGFSIKGDYSINSVSKAGDINGDGYDDVIIASVSTHVHLDVRLGTSYLIYGKENGPYDIDLSNLTSTQGFTIFGDNIYDASGHVVSNAGDFNGDGYDDFIVGSPYTDSSTKFAVGITYLIFGKEHGHNDIYLSNLTPDKGFSIIGSSSSDWSGSAVSGGGDINGDGYDDILIGAWGASPKLNHEGMSYVIYGKNLGFADINLDSLTEEQGFSITGNEYADESSKSLSVAGDINGDGYADIIVNAPRADSYARDNVGVTSVIWGYRQSFIRDITNGGVYEGTSANENFIIDSSSDVTITGGGGNDIFTIISHSNVETKITDFDKNHELIDLSDFDNINDISDLTITSGSAVLNLDNNQKVTILNIVPGDLNSSNFIFRGSDDFEDDDNTNIFSIIKDFVQNPVVLTWAVIGGIALTGLCCIGCIIQKCISSKSTPQHKTLDTKDIDNVPSITDCEGHYELTDIQDVELVGENLAGENTAL